MFRAHTGCPVCPVAGYLNHHDVTADFFQGFEGSPCEWERMDGPTQQWWVAYVLARLAAFANIGGFVFKWETSGEDARRDLRLARLLRGMDPFGHLRTYEAENVTLTPDHFGAREWGLALGS